MSIQRVGGLEEFDELADTTSWDRVCDEDTDVSRVGRAEWMVRVGESDLYRVLFACDEGALVGECDCRGYTHLDRCAHLVALLLAYVREQIQPADLSTPTDDEVDALWAARHDGGDDRPRGRDRPQRRDRADGTPAAGLRGRPSGGHRVPVGHGEVGVPRDDLERPAGDRDGGPARSEEVTPVRSRRHGRVSEIGSPLRGPIRSGKKTGARVGPRRPIP